MDIALGWWLEVIVVPFCYSKCIIHSRKDTRWRLRYEEPTRRIGNVKLNKGTSKTYRLRRVLIQSNVCNFVFIACPPTFYSPCHYSFFS